MIKAIETRYKGYRFRSRLEARWAVYFNDLGVDWEYEPQGFQFDSGLQYLPDFRILDKNGSVAYIEVKRENAFTPSIVEKSVYLAGKIKSNLNDGACNEWRESLAHSSFLGHKYEFYCIDPEIKFFDYGMKYAGPHFSDNHGCYMAHERSVHQIMGCDLLFAWIDSVDAYGTFYEIGFAQALNKPTYIGLSPEMPKNEMWFLTHASKCSGVFSCAKNAWESMVKNQKKPDEEMKVAELSKDHSVFIVMGDPYNHNCHVYRGGCLFSSFDRGFIPSFLGVSSSSDLSAATKARSARFEHGETP